MGGTLEALEPGCLEAWVQSGQEALAVTERGQFATFRVQVETFRLGVPQVVGAEVNGGIQPRAPADQGGFGGVIQNGRMVERGMKRLEVVSGADDGWGNGPFGEAVK